MPASRGRQCRSRAGRCAQPEWRSGGEAYRSQCRESRWHFALLLLRRSRARIPQSPRESRDLVILHLKNALTNLENGAPSPLHVHSTHGQTAGDPCEGGTMNAVSTNLHFHGLTIPPVCHQDEVLKTSIQPGDAAFEYRFRIPDLVRRDRAYRSIAEQALNFSLYIAIFPHHGVRQLHGFSVA